ncbi:Late embryogenesis abundant (LEA) hydroxyproline-rich glycoprotein family [Euphorbia peplus]|nr:Late embryogenesis abundant (LEA) hydroxyproline-rich glycoprotein family [Euphorbia peplus]
MTAVIHPRDSPPSSAEFPPIPQPSPEKPIPPPGTYVINIPKDQIYRVPPPENAKKFATFTRRKTHRSSCCCFLYSLFGVLLTLIILAGISAAVFYFVVKPEAPEYTIDSISIKGLNLTSAGPYSPEFDVTVRADNGNDNIGIDYVSGSSVEVFYEDVRLSYGQLPVFYQGSNNVTVFTTVLKDNGIELTSSVREGLVDGEKKKTVPFGVKLRAPVKLKVGSVKTWTITVKVDCDVTMDSLTAGGKMVGKDCDYSVELW